MSDYEEKKMVEKHKDKRILELEKRILELEMELKEHQKWCFYKITTRDRIASLGTAYSN